MQRRACPQRLGAGWCEYSAVKALDTVHKQAVLLLKGELPRDLLPPLPKGADEIERIVALPLASVRMVMWDWLNKARWDVAAPDALLMPFAESRTRSEYL